MPKIKFCKKFNVPNNEKEKPTFLQQWLKLPNSESFIAKCDDFLQDEKCDVTTELSDLQYEISKESFDVASNDIVEAEKVHTQSSVISSSSEYYSAWEKIFVEHCKDRFQNDLVSNQNNNLKNTLSDTSLTDKDKKNSEESKNFSFYNEKTPVKNNIQSTNTIHSCPSYKLQIQKKLRISLTSPRNRKETKHSSNKSVCKTLNFPPPSPYYLASFIHLVYSAVYDHHHKDLFTDDELQIITKFRNLSIASRKLYVRLFQRKFAFIRILDINYADIGSDLSPFFTELYEKGFIVKDIDNLEETLDLLKVTEMKNLCSKMTINCSGNKNKMKTKLIHLAEKQRHVFSTEVVHDHILSKCKKILGDCLKLSHIPRRLFIRALLLSTLPDYRNLDIINQPLMPEIKMMLGFTYPSYSVNRQSIIYPCWYALQQFQEALELLSQIKEFVAWKKFKEAISLNKFAYNKFISLLNSDQALYDNNLPCFLRFYTAGSVYCYVLSIGVDILQRLRQYLQAVDQLKFLLNQNIYMNFSRGKWFERLVINLDVHLKKKADALQVINTALLDAEVREGLYLTLYQRGIKIASDMKISFTFDDKKYWATTSEIPHKQISAPCLTYETTGQNILFLHSLIQNSSQQNGTIICSVEDVVIQHYKLEGYPHGIHGESQIYLTFFGLFFWNILYNYSVPDCYYTKYQVIPLDINSDHFYENRKCIIDSWLETMSSWSVTEAADFLEVIWDKEYGKASLVSWKLFASFNEIKQLVSCLGMTLMTGICKRLATNYRYTKSGLPDLIVWNPSTLGYKIIEVKGPRDYLSSKQILWLKHLSDLKASVEVCHVKG